MSESILPTNTWSNSSSSSSLLRGAMHVANGWLDRLERTDERHPGIAYMINYIDDRIMAVDCTQETMGTPREMFCVGCRGLNPEIAKPCTGRPLEHCLLLS
jgi:hypothetical protein